jgi:hypothetical protein
MRFHLQMSLLTSLRFILAKKIARNRDHITIAPVFGQPVCASMKAGRYDDVFDGRRTVSS